MKVTLTGANGFIGSHILTELHDHGHEVTALIRDDAQGAAVAANGAAPVVVDLYDRPAVIKSLEDAPTRLSTPPAPVTPPAPISTPRWWTR